MTIATRLAEVASVAVIEAGSFYEIDNGNISQIPLYDAYFTGKDKDDFNPLIDWGFITTPQAVCSRAFFLLFSPCLKVQKISG